MKYERDVLLAEIARRYYLRDQSQQEIADQLDLSRSNISRLLKEARRRGIVEIFIRHSLERDSQLERQLMDRFGLREVGVVQTIPGDLQATIDQAATLASQLLDTFLADGAAITGMRPIAEIQFSDFITLASDQLVNQAAKMRFMFGGKISVPMVLRTPGGSGTGAAFVKSGSLVRAYSRPQGGDAGHTPRCQGAADRGNPRS